MGENTCLVLQTWSEAYAQEVMGCMGKFDVSQSGNVGKLSSDCCGTQPWLRKFLFAVVDGQNKTTLTIKVL